MQFVQILIHVVVKMALEEKYTQTQIDNAMSKAVTFFDTESNKLALDDLYAMKSKCDFNKSGKALLYVYALSTWEQDKFGNTTGYTNYMTQTELTNMISYINKNY